MDDKGTKNNKINVLMIGPDRSVHGGISAVVNGYFDAGLDREVNLTYIGTMKEGSKVYKLLVAFGAYVKFCQKLSKADVIHVNVASDNSFRRKSLFINKAKKAGKKVIIHQHGGEWDDYYSSLGAGEKSKTDTVLKSADRFLVLSPYYRDFFEKKVGVSGVKVFPDTIKIPAKPEKQITGRRILFLGRLCEGKGIRELIEAVIRLHEEYSDISLRLGGIWEDEELRKLIEPYDFITYLGWLDDEGKAAELLRTDIFVMPSYFEGQSLAILEAMTGKCAIVATDVGGIPMMITNQVTGILVQPKDTESLYHGMRQVADNKELAESLADRAYDCALLNFNIDKTVDELVKMYEELTKC